jgi:hypothetical protein
MDMKIDTDTELDIYIQLFGNRITDFQHDVRLGLLQSGSEASVISLSLISFITDVGLSGQL